MSGNVQLFTCYARDISHRSTVPSELDLSVV